MITKLNYNQLVQDVHDGLESPLKAFAMIKTEMDSMQEALDYFKEYAIEEANKRSEKTFEEEGFKFELRKGGALYDYSQCNKILEVQNLLKDLQKEAQKNAKVKGEVVSLDGEIQEKAIIKYKSDSLIVKSCN